MELTAQTLREVMFGQKVRGYDPNDVDDFIDQVAVGVDELHERLRQANERAAAAEAGQGAQAPANAVPITSASDIGKVWERAAAAAESAVEEARQEAARILEEARSNAAAAEAAVEEARAEAARVKEDARNQARHESDQTLQSARAEAESTLHAAREEAEDTLNSARAEAEHTRGSARAEAARLAEESQGELRQELSQLEEARRMLQENVQALSSYLDSELSKVRNTLQEALHSIENTAVGAEAPPSISHVDIPASRYSGDAAGFGSAASTEVSNPWQQNEPTSAAPLYDAPDNDFAQSEDVPEAAAEFSYGQPAEESTSDSYNVDDRVIDEVAPWDRETSTETAPWEEPSWGAEEPSNETPAEESPYVQPEEDDDVDPFLAELRRAVHDEGPLGPRDEPSEETSIDSLYSDDDDDKNGFFRRKK